MAQAMVPKEEFLLRGRQILVRFVGNIKESGETA
jgi:hypothetical protein